MITAAPPPAALPSRTRLTSAGLATAGPCRRESGIVGARGREAAATTPVRGGREAMAIAPARGGREAVAAGPRVRVARPTDAPELALLSGPFVRSGALRPRPLALYAAHAADFLVAEGSDGTLEGFLGLRHHPAAPSADRGPSAVLYNFCVAPHRQGHGVGGRLLRAAFTQGRAHALDTLFTATTGDGTLFLRHGFTPAPAHLAPPRWVGAFDPGRATRVLARGL
ncbi:GNAT family N-acetyltransferase [Streptomyces sp. SCSIO ZS0520]|uniref:GNAT family N-acetyltransferase n=1 Tax=Streptomyces sp. SCSIO ZS0520 TaxID=2892996 RepID=UPI002954AF61|nr:GNAT family N-acetyltransferase [Streptomyces sp. SCSIO ZS0520]